MNILSIQSWVSYGHVGNAAALFPLQRLGAEVWTINTVQFSNHPGYGSHTGRIAGGEAVAELIDGLAARDLLGRLDAVLSGYLGDAATGEALLDGVARARARNPALLFCCDPVLGDRGPGVYVAPGLAALLRDRAVAQADILTPNQFELFHLLGRRDDAAPSLETLVAAAQTLRGRMRPGGRRLVLVSSVQTTRTDPDGIALLLVDDTGAHLLATPRLPLETNGAGDLLAALFLFHLLRGGDAPASLGHAASSVWCVLARTVALGRREPAIIEAQQELVTPSRHFRAVPVAVDACSHDRGGNDPAR